MGKSNTEEEYELAGSAYYNIRSKVETKSKVTTKAIINLVISIASFITATIFIDYDDLKRLGILLFALSAMTMLFAIGYFKQRSSAYNSEYEYMKDYSHPIFGSIENLQSVIDQTNETARYVDARFVIGDKYLIDKTNLANVVEIDEITGVIGEEIDEFYYLGIYVDRKLAFKTHYPINKKSIAKLKEMQQYCPNAVFKI